MPGCHSCQLRQTIASPTPNGRCLWFLRKLQPARDIPDDVVNVGCKSWRPQNGLKTAGYGEQDKTWLPRS